MAKSPARRLSIGGELVPPGPNIAAQALYLETVRQAVPEAMTALKAIARSSNGTGKDQIRGWCLEWGFTGVPDRYGDWLLKVAQETADYFRTREPGLPDVWRGVSASYWGPGGENIDPPQWHPDHETEEQYDERVKAYKAMVRQQATAAGWTDVIEKRNLGHFLWLARYQVAKWTEKRISEEEQDTQGHPDIPAVSKAVTATARLIGLQLRPAQGRTLP